MLAVFLFAFFAALLPKGVLAATANVAKQVGLQYLTTTGLTTIDIRTYVGRIIRYFLGLLGIIAVSLILYAGFLYMTSQGSEEKIKKAKAIMINAVIGLFIILSAYAIVAFILGAVTGQGGATSTGSGGPQNFVVGVGNRNSALGNGIIEYHYPEPGQTDVPRNTKISITFKKPLVLSTVFKNYDDKGTYDVGDDVLCNPGEKPPACTGAAVTGTTKLELNTDNFKIIPNDSLKDAGTGSFDDQFNNRYPDVAALVNPAPTAKVTAVAPLPFKAPQDQTIVMKPLSPIGSPTTDVNYRVALRGGENGIKVWDETNDPSKPAQILAFTSMAPDGSYYWSFTTNTTIDVTPPQIVAVIPDTTPTPGQPTSSILDRNQLLQIYFSEAVDPTTASGIIGTGGGFNNVDIQAKCLPGTYPKDCSFNGGNPGTVDGTLNLGNRYRTAEFVPSTACEGITENSCGEPVYCLPKNVSLTVVSKAATLDFLTKSPEPPAASVDNGVEDMVGNSLDGNNDGIAQGPQDQIAADNKVDRPQSYYRNDPQSPLDGVSDTAHWDYVVGSNVDLTVPVLLKADPPASGPPLPPDLATDYPTGPSNVPVTTPVAMTWSKTMSVSSMRTGSFDENTQDYADPYSTIVFRAYECQKNSTAACTPGNCPCTRLPPPGFYVGGLASDDPPESMLVADPNGGPGKVTRIAILHPVVPFMTANDLGYTEADITASPLSIPSYVPIARAKLKDTKQNCFWPSRYAPTGSDCVLNNVGNPAQPQYSCCNKQGVLDGKFAGPGQCAPLTP